MGRIALCHVCMATGSMRSAEIYDGLENPPEACWKCEPALLFEQRRIIQLLKDLKAEELSPDDALAKGWRFDESTGKWGLPFETLIKIIRGDAG